MESDVNDMDTVDELSLGGTLAKRRETVGLSQEDVAKKLYLSVTYIKNLEQNKFDKLCQSPVFVRGYVRSYARLVKLDEVKINSLLDENGIIEKVEPTKIMLPRRHRQVSTKDKKMRWITYFIILVLIILVITWWHSRVSHKQMTQVKAPAITSTANVILNPQTTVGQQAAKTLPATSNIVSSTNSPTQQTKPKASSAPNLPHKLHMNMSNS